jgi:hypothetical protein
MVAGAPGRVHTRSTEEVLEAVGDLGIAFREEVAVGVVGYRDRRAAHAPHNRLRAGD